MQKKYFYIAVLLICVLISQNFENLTEYPKYIHTWAQSDRYALALGFIENDFDFFHPQTFVLNHQFPGEFKIPSDNSITAVDFPIHEYIIAGLMKGFNDHSPFLFRIYILLYSLIGLVFLYKSVFLITNNYAKSLFVTLFAASSPVFLYYQSGFLPTIPSLANSIIGLYLYIKYINSGKITSFYWSVFFFTLAALSRTPFAIYIIALSGIILLGYLRSKKLILKALLALITSIIVLIGYFLYNFWLRENYGSIFLANVLIPSSWNEVKEILRMTSDKWLYQYFTKAHYIYIIALFLVSIFYFRKGNWKIQGILAKLSLFFSVVMIGVFSYSFLMLRQFPAHDYYFLDTFFLPVIILLILFLQNTPSFNFRFEKHISLVLVIGLFVPLFVMTSNVQTERMTLRSWDRASRTVENFSNSKQLLDSLKIRNTAKMLVIDACAPNIPFMLMERYGYAIMTTSQENISRSLLWDYDYIIFQNEFFISDIYSYYPDFINKTKVIATNNMISVCERSSDSIQVPLLHYLGFRDAEPLIREIMTFDSAVAPDWENINITDSNSIVGEHAGLITGSDEFGISYKLRNPSILKDKSRILFIKGKVTSHIQNATGTFIVVLVSDKQGKLYYDQHDLGTYIKDAGDWNTFNLSYYIPKVEASDFEFAIYVWNNGKNVMYLDDLEILAF